jgi:uncharacterized delta-60 repeat protein
MKKNLFRLFSIAAPFILLISLCALPVWAAGEVDTNFNASLIIAGQGTISQTLVQADGKIIIAGGFRVVGKYSRTHIARLNADGTLDLTFNPVELDIVFGDTVPVKKLGLQSDGKIIVGGNFALNRQQRALIRLHTDGSLDASFLDPTAQNNLNGIRDFEITPDDRIIYAGDRGFFGYTFGRINSDGTLDREFNIPIFRIALQPDGKIITYNSATFNIDRYNQDFTIDNTFQPPFVSHSVRDIAVQADGKILIAGNLSAVNNFAISRIARLNANGTIDGTFNIGTAGPNKAIEVIQILPDGKILIGGEFTTFNGAAANHVARLNPANGSLDASFNSGINITDFIINDLDLSPDGKIITASIPMFRLNTNGSLDASLASPVIGDVGFANKVLVQPDNKILVGGYFTMANEKVIRHLARFNADGTVDNTFNQTVLSINSTINAIALQPDGKILIGFDAAAGGGARLNPDGSFDRAITTGALVTDIKVLPDGKILMSGPNYVKRFNADGTADNTFNIVAANARIHKMAIQPDGKILIGGDFTQVNSTPRQSVARLNADGTLDAAFNPLGGANGSVYDLAVQADGKILIGGDFTGVNFDTTKKYLARLNSDGSLDTSFAPVISAKLRAVRIETSGKILVGGITDANVLSPIPGKLYRLNADGTLDAAFNNSLVIDQKVNSIDLQSDGKIILAGLFSRINGVSNLGVARLFNSARTMFDYDGDGRADISLFRPSENQWYVLRSSDSTVSQQVFAIAGDIPVPADYDGDGKTDFAIFRPSSNDWWALYSSNGAQAYAHWGQTGVIPRPSDFDGDGRADYIFFLPSNSTWYRYGTTAGPSYVTFGLTGDKPVTGDFDGDRKTDVAIFRPSTGDWWWQSSIDGVQRATHWGISTDIPAPGDFDGDGKTDFAVFRPSEGNWYVFNSSNFSSTVIHFGISEDKPVPADYDGDGKTDIAVFRPSNGAWYLLQSTAGFTATSFGLSTDIPTPNAFVP